MGGLYVLRKTTVKLNLKSKTITLKKCFGTRKYEEPNRLDRCEATNRLCEAPNWLCEAPNWL